tara:strand:- start:9206 stop:10366 length:1161 start_codon:yes stop_codon:yes gene_type:complete
MRLILIIFIQIIFSVTLLSQNEGSPSFWKSHFEFDGYVKFMQTFTGDQEGNIYDQSLWHNRINTKFRVNPNHEVVLQARNRIIYGEAVKLDSQIKSSLDFDNGIADLSLVVGEEDGFLYSGIIDRFYYKGVSGDWEWSLGRQRINWGINTFFNANDIFNAFTITDFDYEERPGSDAVRIQKYFKNGSDIELAGAIYTDTSIVAALKYGWNYKNYDLQVLVGKYYDDYVFGGGWAGNIKNWGFKGEMSYFIPNSKKVNHAASVSVSAEYIINNGKFISVGGLYSSSGLRRGADISTALLSFNTSAKNLMPTQWTGMFTFGGQLKELSNFAIVVLYMPEVNMGLLMPSISYSIARNWDVSIFMINVAGVVGNDFIALANGFFRMKYSF